MKKTAIIALSVFATMSALAGQEPPPAPKLESLQGTMIMMVSENSGVPCKVWAKGNNTRVEMGEKGKKVITIQIGSTMYTFIEGDRTGTKQRLGTGLASMGMIRQIDEVKAKGKKIGSRELEGVSYDTYQYDVNAPKEMAMIVLATETSLPFFWVSAVQTSATKATGLRMHYRDMKANADVPDNLFRLPASVAFREGEKP